MKWPLHGSNPQYLYQSMGVPLPDHYIDFSANINPLGPPPSLKEKWGQAFELINDYPDPKAYQFSIKAAEKEGLPVNWILPGNGGSELIALIARLLAGKRVLIVQPAFSEYEEACKANGCQIGYHILEEGKWELMSESIISELDHYDALFLCNPNNPTGTSFSRHAISRVLKESAAKNCFVIIDEAFYDFSEEVHSFASSIQTYPNLMVLRSMTKMYSIPGIRLGYAIAHPHVLKEMAVFQPHWSVNALALMAGEECLKANEHVRKTRRYIGMQRSRLVKFFQENGYEVSNFNVNFYLVRDSDYIDQLPLICFLLEHGIVPRHTYHFPGLEGRWIRLAIKREDENDRLMEVLAKWRTVK
ncbi:threonine-phosphate decarboxylase [Bacillus methanolicus PB1]|uniref:threonine-phosphate decarboxylase n=1 Tax=Bacillus methanolicus PB1 TaxID=997296 RepID=I3E079_BACMT|nr:threonine-phosphate decarboxylase CobD [Bacillus methanolicus]EIJ79900.1 threonine-phosphate decarboxylase [Bacillus methanolicus PB1]